MVIEVDSSFVSASDSGSGSCFAELVGSPFSAGAGGAVNEGACSSLVRTFGHGGKCYLVMKPRTPGGHNFVDPTSTNTMISFSGLAREGASLHYAMRVWFTMGRMAGYSVSNT